MATLTTPAKTRATDARTDGPVHGGVTAAAAVHRAPRKIGRRVALLVGLLVGAVFAGFPVFWMLISSFKTNTEIFAYPPQIITQGFSFDAYLAVLNDPEEIRFFINSYVVALSVTALTVVFAIMAAYAFSRYEFRGKKVMNVIIIGTQAVPPIALIIPFFGLMVTLGLYNTYAGLILTYIVFTLPYAIIMMTAYFNTLPKELDEAVKVDGAGAWTALWRILVPISVPGIVSVAVYTFMISWNEYLFALTLTRTNDLRTVPVGIQLLIGQNSYEWNQMMAISIMGSIPVLLLFLIFQRYFIGGLTSGSVKS
ncbi:sugar ABC transporter permease [Subtercola boreus]|uniref:Sugar ABC transporter permease n=1 Tax=Subtercola boreus TaxID=120213 RepID=A0A3E0VB21_9MICO|nr:carbohydrate ABC transporter permease [Subtercola boreus]RFA07014.1 sugar ABC transporter permease [Subtercola boreus]